MKKLKLLFLLIVGVMMLALCGCEREEDSESEKDKGNNYYGNYYGSDYEEEEEEAEKVDKSTIIIAIVIGVINACICCAIGSNIMDKCGLSQGKGSALGLLLGELGLLICFCDCIESLSNRIKRNESSSEHMEQKITSYRKDVGKVSSNGDWYCTNCGRLNANYVGTCGCGASKY